MDVSVVVPTLNGRDRLASCLDALAEHAPDVEVVVVNGPSTDGTSGMVRDRDDVDVLVELDARNINVSRNAGLDEVSGDAVAFLGDSHAVESTWPGAIRAGLEDAAAVTGPVHRELRAGHTTEEVERRTIAGREVTYFDGGNVALRRTALEALDGFDEYLATGGARDAAHRLAGLDRGVTWEGAMSVRRTAPPVGLRARQPTLRADGGRPERDWTWRYRSLSYRLWKNYGPRPTVAYRVGRHAVTDAVGALRDVASGEATPSSWLGNGRDVLAGVARGTAGGLLARWRDRSERRNPNGWSGSADRAVDVTRS